MPEPPATIGSRPAAGKRPGATELLVTTDDGVRLAGEDSNPARPATGGLHSPGNPGPLADRRSLGLRSVVLLHGLTATRRYVVMGSRVLERAGLRVASYDARGHGHSTPAPRPGERGYGYERLARDLLTVLDALGLDRATLAGASMGAHTIVRFALEYPERVAAIGLITPAYDPIAHGAGPNAFAEWDALARGLREGGVEGFVAANELSSIPDTWRATVEQVLRQRLSAHDHPEAVADALEAVPRSRPFERWADLARIEAPATVISSRDEADPSHPLAVGERYAQALSDAQLLVEDAGVDGHPIPSPIAWQGGQLSKALLDLTDRM